VLPPVWGYFGPEWSDPASDGGPRCTSGTGTLYLFTPSSLAAQVVLDPPQGDFPGTLQVAVNGGEVVVAERLRKRDDTAERDRNGNAVQVPLSLAAGWNRVTLTLVNPDQPEAAAEVVDPGTPCSATDPARPPLRIKSVDVRYEER
jgi:hypothetical protein